MFTFASFDFTRDGYFDHESRYLYHRFFLPVCFALHPFMFIGRDLSRKVARMLEVTQPGKICGNDVAIVILLLFPLTRKQ